jgi:hypothetical protein
LAWSHSERCHSGLSRSRLGRSGLGRSGLSRCTEILTNYDVLADLSLDGPKLLYKAMIFFRENVPLKKYVTDSYLPSIDIQYSLWSTVLYSMT